MKTLKLICLICLIGSCSKNESYDSIPAVPVNISVLLNLPEFTALNSVGGSHTINGGYKGIIIYRRSQDEFVAYDRACPYDPTNSSAILVAEASGIIVTDNNCGSKFSLYDGSITHGPSTRPMKPYQTQYDAGSNTLLIFN